MRHRIGQLLVSSFLLLSSCKASERVPAAGLIVHIDSGSMQGVDSVDNPKVALFLGIPNAAPPVGELRWKPPQPPARWDAIRKADELSAACPQSDFMYRAIQRTVSTVGGDPSQIKPVGKTSEDCLYLNVITTGLDHKDLKR
jgi:para-nitrobenzyl esterase